MPTAENIFPKVGNDPLYASEVNRFSQGGRFITAGSFIVIPSGTAATNDGVPRILTAGSILIPAGSLVNTSNPIQTTMYIYADMPGSSRFRVNVSGAGILNTDISDNIGSSSNTDYRKNFFQLQTFYGSPVFDNSFIRYVNNTGDTNNANLQFNVGAIPPGSNIVYSFHIIADGGTGSTAGSLTVRYYAVVQNEGLSFL